MDGVEEFRWLFAAEYPAVVRTVFFVLHDRARAEEIAQDAFVQLLRHWKKVSRYESPEAWVRRVAIRLAVRDANRERRLAVLRLGGTAEAPGFAAEMDVDLLAAIKQLPPRQRCGVWLREGSGQLLRVSGDGMYALDNGGQLAGDPDDTGSVEVTDVGTVVLTSGSTSRVCAAGDHTTWTDVQRFGDRVLRGVVGDDTCSDRTGTTVTWIRLSP